MGVGGEFEAESAAAIERELDAEIERNRIVEAELFLRSGSEVIANAEVEVEQTTHGLLLGTNWGGSSAALFSGEASERDREMAMSRNARFREVFNQATLPFYWSRFETERGKPATEALRAAALRYREEGVALKGHPLCWHTLSPRWLLGLGEDEVLEEQLARVRRDVAGFKGIVDAWDAVNEAVIMPDFDREDNGITRLCRKMGRVNLIKAVFDEARAANPEAVLLLNDFNYSSAFASLIEECLEAGVKIDAIGVQSHMHQGWWGVEKIRTVLERFSRFGLPIHFTEITILSGEPMPPEIEDLNDFKVGSWPSTPEGEQRQAREVVLSYKALAANPAVEAITWWDLCDGAWLGAPGGLLRKDGSPKRAFEALKSLVKKNWWIPRTKMRTDEAGRVEVRGFAGDYRVFARGSSAEFRLSKDDRPGQVVIEALL